MTVISIRYAGMFRSNLLFTITFFLFLFCFSGYTYSYDFRNFYGVSGTGNYADNVKYARQMGYHAVAYQYGMQFMSEASDMKFYILNPEYYVSPISRRIDLTKTYSAADIQKYESMFALKNDSAMFPENMATGWWPSDSVHDVVYDWQQQGVIDSIIEDMVAYTKKAENPSINFRVAGFMWDVSHLTGDFWTAKNSSGGVQVGLEYWTGADSCASTSHKHDYSTFSDGRAAFYKQLYQRMRDEFPGVKFIMEPYRIYDQWIEKIKDRPDAAQIMPDMLLQEHAGTEFVDDERIVDSGLITMDRVGASNHQEAGEYENRLYAAKAAVEGAWYVWFGGFGNGKGMPGYGNVDKVPARLQLIRQLPIWDNLADVPLEDRSWDGNVYKSSNSYADSDIIYSRHPGTGKIFTVFLNTEGFVELTAGENVISVMRTDKMFIEAEDGSSDVEISGNKIRLLNETYKGKGYIIEVSDETTPLPPLNVVVTIHGL